MTLTYRITFTDGRQATMLDPAEKRLPTLQASVLGRFGAHRVREIERVDHDNKEPPDEN